MRASDIEQTMKICNSTYSEAQKAIKALLDDGKFNYIENYFTPIANIYTEL